MLTPTEITAAAAARLISGKLTARDINGLVGVFRMFFADLEQKYSYEWAAALTALDDTADTENKQLAAQVAACIIRLEGLGFGVAQLQGGSDALFYKEKEKYIQYVLIAHSKLYSIPAEFSNYSLARRASTAKSGTAFSTRVEPFGFGISSERSARRRSSRRNW